MSLSTINQSLSRRELYRLVEDGWFANFIQKASLSFSDELCVFSQSCPTVCDCSLPGSSVHGIIHWSGLPFPPPGVFPTQELNPPLLRLLHCRWNFDPLTRWGSPSFKDTASIFHLEREAYNQYIPRRLITWGSCFLKPIKIIQKSVLPTSGLVLIKTHTGF